MASFSDPPHSQTQYIPAAFVWDERFTTRQEKSYRTIDNRIDRGRDLVEAFLEPTSILDPPQYSYAALRSFIASANRAALTDRNLLPRKNIILDDRRDPTVGTAAAGTHSVRDWTSDFYQKQPPPGDYQWHHRLTRKEATRQNISPTQAERRTVYVADLSPTIALAIMLETAPRQTKIVRDFLQRHVVNRGYFAVSMTAGFAFELHLPYFALRKRAVRSNDIRKIRQSRPASATSRAGTGGPGDFVHQAQISILITGIDEWIWTALCCVDTYFETDDQTEEMYYLNLDAPTGAENTCDKPIWNPREYFLVALANRVHQVTLEWAIIICEFESRLSKFFWTKDRFFYDTDTLNAGLKDDKNLNRTKEYTWSTHILRTFYNSLTNLIEAWESFRASELRLLFSNLSEPMRLRWQVRTIRIEQDLSELRYFRRSLLQKIEMFDSLKDGLVNASALSESQVATSQGQNITLLTWLTVMYLPPSLVTGIYGMSMVSPTASWSIYAGVIVLMVSLTALGLVGVQRSYNHRKERSV
ncbi:MAG: hypothetical protein M1828_002991 [Chrysothrix sp. TS-e1954]|nr:MAG: hypothetical protein M1828_002991 [Chrysothrix sp. TS-e1954]